MYSEKDVNWENDYRQKMQEKSMKNVLLREKDTAITMVITKKKPCRKKRKKDSLKQICWFVLPLSVILLVIADAVGFYVFNTERLLVLGIGTVALLLPCFSEVSIKDITVRRNKPKE